MKRTLSLLVLCCVACQCLLAQHFGDFPTVKQEKLLNDLDLLYQGLDKFHSGMYWYTPKDSVDAAFEEVRNKIDRDLNVLEFHKLIAPLVALSREGHTYITLPENVRTKITKETRFFPFSIVFLDKRMYCVRNGSDFSDFPLEGKEIEAINGESPTDIVNKIGTLLTADGFIKASWYSDLRRFSFARHYFYYYGELDQISIKLKGIETPISVKSLTTEEIRRHFKQRSNKNNSNEQQDLLEYKVLNESTAYLGIHSFSNSEIKEASKEKNLKTFLENSFKSIAALNIKTLIIDVSKNSGGTEGNEGLLYAYLGENYKKYNKVRVKTQKAILDNGVDKPIKLKAFGFLERWLNNRKMKDGSLERKQKIGLGLMAYKKEPEHKFNGKTYVITSPITHSGGSEFSNMVYTQNLATFVGQETGGGYFGNTSGYSSALVLPHSKLKIAIPALQFLMNVAPKIPFGRGVIPHHKVVPSIEQYLDGENASVKFILETLEKN